MTENSQQIALMVIDNSMPICCIFYYPEEMENTCQKIAD
jgi:hypothetical protein